MAKATHVYYEGICEYDNNTRIFRTLGNDAICDFFVEGFENGIATVNPPVIIRIDNFAEAVAGCFDEDSNFGAEVLEAYNCDENVTFIGIKFEFNGVTLTVTKENADKDRIYKEWKAGMEANEEKHRREHEAWLKTPEGQEYLAQKKAEAERQKAVEAEVRHIDETTEMEFKDEEGKKAWDSIVELNSKNPYGAAVVNYARRWAKYMQKLIAEGKSVEESAKQSFHDCGMGEMTTFAYSCVVDVLVKSWKHGEELRKWHNKEYEYEGDGVANPAVLTVNVE